MNLESCLGEISPYLSVAYELFFRLAWAGQSLANGSLIAQY